MVARAMRGQSSPAQPKWASAGAEVSVRADDRLARPRRAERIAQQRFVLRPAQIVAADDRDAWRAQSQFRGECGDAFTGGPRVRRAEIADDADAAALAVRQHRLQQIHQQRLVAGARVVPARELRQREGSLGERLEDQHRRAAAGQQGVDHRASRVGAVARKAGGAADAQDVVSISHGFSWSEM
jgi:hypothetical protein